MPPLRLICCGNAFEEESSRIHRKQVPVTVSSEDEAHRAQLLHLVHEEIDNLEDAFRSTLLKRFFDGMSYREISVALNCSTGTVSSRLSRAIDQIRSNLDSRGIGSADTSGDIYE